MDETILSVDGEGLISRNKHMGEPGTTGSIQLN